MKASKNEQLLNKLLNDNIPDENHKPEVIVAGIGFHIGDKINVRVPEMNQIKIGTIQDLIVTGTEPKKYCYAIVEVPIESNERVAKEHAFSFKSVKAAFVAVNLNFVTEYCNRNNISLKHDD